MTDAHHHIQVRDVTLIGGESLRFARLGNDRPSSSQLYSQLVGLWSFWCPLDLIRSGHVVSSSISYTLFPTRIG